MTIVACILHLVLNHQPATVIVTGKLIENNGKKWMVDISNSVSAYDLDPDYYHYYVIDSEDCVKKELSHK